MIKKSNPDDSDPRVPGDTSGKISPGRITVARVLVVEDEPVVRRTLERMVAAEGHQVLLAEDADSARALLDEHEVDIVLTDIVLDPEGDEEDDDYTTGVDLLAEIRQQEADQPEVILITGRPDMDSAIRAVQENAFDYLVKPVSRQDLALVLNRAIESKKLKKENLELWEANQKYRERLEEVVQERTGRIVRLNRSLQDEIQEHERDKDALRASEERLRAFAKALPDAAFVLSEDGRYVEVLTSRERLLVAPPEELLGRKIDEVVSEEAAAPFLAAIRRALEDDEPQTVEYELEVPAGKLLFEGYVAPMRTPPGEERLVVWVARDVTARREADLERQKYEVQVRQSQKLESLGVMAGRIAHDFNNLMTSVVLQAELVEEELPMISPIREHVGEICTAAEAAANLAREMLAYAGERRGSAQVVDLNRVVRGNTHLIRASIPKKIALDLKTGTDSQVVEADSAQLSQVVMNLVTNAAEAIEDRRGTIRVVTETVTMEDLSHAILGDELPGGRYVRLAVQDDGGGMDVNTQARIFDPFFTTKLAGRGLGLSTVLGIVRAHGGAVEVKSEPGRGTTIAVLLPASRRQVVADGGDTETELSGTILLADDEAGVRKAVRQTLQKIGFDVLTAADGREAVNVFREHADEVRVVLLDKSMPHLSGEEALREIRAVRADVPAILSSGYSEDELAARSEGEGFDGYLQKPFQVTALRRTVRTVLAAAQAAEGTKT